jgi:hypothetical protein
LDFWNCVEEIPLFFSDSDKHILLASLSRENKRFEKEEKTVNGYFFTFFSIWAWALCSALSLVFFFILRNLAEYIFIGRNYPEI